jgi:hypothetical protein
MAILADHYQHLWRAHYAQIVLIRDEFSKQSRAASHLTACGEVGVSAPGGVGELRLTRPCKLSTSPILDDPAVVARYRVQIVEYQIFGPLILSRSQRRAGERLTKFLNPPRSGAPTLPFMGG